MKKYRINRKKWARGSKCLNYLWNEERQTGCCLGHVIRQEKHIPWRELNLIPEPEKYSKPPEFLAREYTNYPGYFSNTSLAGAAMEINDNSSYTDSKREKELIRIFKDHKIELEFYN